MNTVTSGQFLDFIESFGLAATDQSGGYLPIGLGGSKIRMKSDVTIISTADAKPIMILPPTLFLNTVAATEESLNVKLFH